jgi:hypothetical protein
MRFGLQTKPLTKEMKTKNVENKQTKNLQNKQKKSSSDKFFFFQTQENVLRKGLVNSLNYGSSKKRSKNSVFMWQFKNYSKQRITF